MKVCKFGGSSVATADQVSRVCDIVLNDPERRIVVVSAPGKREPGDKEEKITDQLIGCAQQHLAGQDARPGLQRVVARYHEIGTRLGVDPAVLDTIHHDFEALLDMGDLSRERFLDRMKAAGEDNSAKLVAGALRARGAEAHYVNPKQAGMVLSDEAGNARVLEESYRNLSQLRHAPGITVFPGFFGATPDGHVVTFPRGGSDITGSILARAVQANLYENFTDVECVRVVDPELVPNARPIAELTYREMRELSYTGFSVFNDEALAPVAQVGIPVCIRSTNNLNAPGTRIVSRRDFTPGEIVGIASLPGFTTLFVSKYLMNREVGFGRRLLHIVEEEGLSYEHSPTGIDSISLILRTKQLTPELRDRIEARIHQDLEPDEVSVEDGYALVMVVGEGMRDTPGIAARATRALARARINIEMMNQGSSEISMAFGVKEDKHKQAVKALYREFFGEHH